MHGSGGSRGALLDLALVELRLLIFPVVLGEGKRLVDGIDMHASELAELRDDRPDSTGFGAAGPADEAVAEVGTPRYRRSAQSSGSGRTGGPSLITHSIIFKSAARSINHPTSR